MGDYMSSPFDFHAEQFQVFHAALGGTLLREGLTEAVERAIKEAIEVALQSSLKGVTATVKKLLRSNEGVEAVFRQLIKGGWEVGEEIPEKLLKEAVGGVGKGFDEVVGGFTKGISKGLDDALAETGTKFGVNWGKRAGRRTVRNGIPQAAGEAAETLARKIWIRSGW